MKDKPTYKTSVRNLVEFILRSGDIDMRRGTSDREAMLKGGRLHRKIQKQMGSLYRAEVPLKLSREFDDLVLVLEGRADGLFEKDGVPYVDEIKGLSSGVGKLEEPVPVHLAQAKCYAVMLAADDPSPSFGIQMTYGGLDNDEIKRFTQVFEREELIKWFEELVDAYHTWLSWRLSWIKTRNASIQGLTFPFPYREGQKKLVGSIYHTISENRQIFIQAPTGIGKTMAAVYPSIRALGEEKAEALFYLTARTTTRTVAEEAIRILTAEGLRFKSVTITAKEKVCLCDEVKCVPDYCPYARGYEDRVNAAVFEFLQKEILYDRQTISDWCREKELCPFEFTLDLALWVDGLICDYNYVFDPDAYLRRFFGEGRNEKYIFLVDEAHNLVERSREMYSAVLRRSTIMEMRKKSRGKVPALVKALNKVNKSMLSLEKETEEGTILESPGMLPLHLLSVQGEIEKLFEEEEMRSFTDEILDGYFEVRRFVNTCELLGDDYVVYTGKDAEGKLIEKLFCISPARNLSDHLKNSAGTIFFSATFLPLPYYRKLLSTREDDYGVYVPSPFPQENRIILTCGDVSSRYTRRGYEEYRKIAEYIARTASAKKGNYMVFFPSYALLQAVYEVYESEFSMDWVRCICQTPDMGERGREEFLEQFSENKESLVAFCIMGGIFSEGIDLTGDRLIGAIIVGPGIPQVNTEREILKGYYDALGENGFDYAYRFPGMNKVLQAAGRVIRTSSDTGVILLLDDRFRQRDYAALMPTEWSDRKMCRIALIEDFLREFWAGARSEKTGDGSLSFCF